MTSLIVLVPKEAASRIISGGARGMVTFKVSDAENAGFVHQISAGPDTPLLPVELEPRRTHFLNSGDVRQGGLWFRVAPDLHVAWYLSRCKNAQLSIAGFREAVAPHFKNPGTTSYIAITYAPGIADHVPEVTIPEIVAWYITSDGATPVDVDREPDFLGTARLEPHWPVSVLTGMTVMVIGLGSIGGAAAYALAGYGVGHLILVDPDRLRWRNLIRHVCGPAHVGRLKVSAIREDLQYLRPDTRVSPHPLDVVTQADQIRPLLANTDLIVGATDQVAPRRVISHLGRRARIDTILACVLENGGIGELLRLHPWPDRGCLVCQRQTLHRNGGIDPEPHIDADYGGDTRHRPMTAVGADLHLVGQLAAKAAVATLLERRGAAGQKLAGDHAVISLRPRPLWAPPFDLKHTAAIRWSSSTPPIPGCPTCEDP